jgi:hypothetical protein
MKEAIAARLGFFVRSGQLPALPSPWQLRVGLLAMLPVTLSESPRERESSRRTWLGQVPIRVPLQILYSPSQLGDASGLCQSPRQIVRHLLSVYHEPAFLGYDLQLLASHPGGLALLIDEASAVARGAGPWAPLLRRLVGGTDYHASLPPLAAAAQRGEYPDPLDLDPRFVTLVGFSRFCLTLPDWPEASFYGLDRERIRDGGWRG